VLEGVEAKVGLTGGVGMAVDGDYAAFFSQFRIIARHVRSLPGLRIETWGTQI
jgi:hypothetical protein